MEYFLQKLVENKYFNIYYGTIHNTWLFKLKIPVEASKNFTIKINKIMFNKNT